MADFKKLAHDLVLQDAKITTEELTAIKKHLKTDGKYDDEAIEFLAAIRSAVVKKEGEIPEEFDEFFLKTLHGVVVKEGAVSDEHVALLEKHVVKGKINEDKRREFFSKLKKAASNGGTKFTALFEKLYPTEKKEEAEKPAGKAKASAGAKAPKAPKKPSKKAEEDDEDADE